MQSDIDKCKTALDAYSFPVQSMVIAHNGTIVSTLNANDLLERSNSEAEKFRSNIIGITPEMNRVYEDPISFIYRSFLENATIHE